MAIVHT